MKKFSNLFLAFTVLPIVMTAQTPTDSVPHYNMKEVVVTATLIPQEMRAIPQRITVLPTYLLNANPMLSIDDVMNQVAGLSVGRTLGLMDKHTLISLRGMGSEQGRTLVLYDGVPVNKASTGSVNLNRYNPAMIERIEIVKGPNSSIYGGDAMGGVVNIISKNPTKPMEGTAAFKWGEMATFGTNASLGGLLGKFSYLFDGFYQKSNGYNSTPKADRDESTIASDMHEYSIGTKLAYHFTPLQSIEGSARYYDGKRGTGTRIFLSDPLKGQVDLFNKYRQQDYSLTYRGEAGNNHWTVAANYGQEKYNDLKSKGTSIYDVTCTRRDWNIWTSFYNTSIENNIISGGLEVKGGYVDGRDLYRSSTDQVIDQGKSLVLGFRVQDEISLFDSQFKIIPSLRYDWSRVYDGGFFINGMTNVTSIYEKYTGKLPNNTYSAFSPKLSLQYTFNENYRIFTNAGWAFRPGNLEDMVRTGPIQGGVIIANTNLKPEHLFSVELGGDFSFLNKILVLSPSFYYSRGTDFIYNVNTGETIMMGTKKRPLLLKSNLGKVNIYGAEIQLGANVSDNVNLFANYSYTNSKVAEGTVFISGNEVNLHGHYLTYVPKNKYVFGGTWRNPYVNVSATYVQYSSQYIDDLNEQQISQLGTVDAKLWHTFANKVTLSVNARNIFDSQINDNGIMTIGRVVFGEIQYRF